MIVSFSVENYLSFRRKVVVDFQAGSIKEYKENFFNPSYNTNYALLKSVGIFGHNASGKSNIMKAFSFMKDFVVNSSKESNSSQEIKVSPFKLATDTEKEPSVFEIIFILDSTKYRYGFSVSKKAVDSEWLFFTEKRKENNLFIRAKQNYNFEKKFKEGMKGKFELFSEVTRTNTLFLSVLAQFNNKLCVSISEWFNDLIFAHDLAHTNLIDFTASLMNSGDYRKMINEIIKSSDLGIDSVEEKEITSSNRTSFKDFIS
jgi:AAA15 family ATPase/GTPase